MWDNIAYLGTIKEIDNGYGDLVENVVYVEQPIFLNKKSVSYSEFYQAQAKGYKPELIIEVNLLDYNLEEYVLYENVEYKVIKTYQKKEDTIEITLERKGNQHKLDGFICLDGSEELDRVY